jgi:hypothetical protein
MQEYILNSTTIDSSSILSNKLFITINSVDATYSVIDSIVK